MFGDRFRVGDSSPRVAEVRGTLARLGFIDGFDGDAAGDGSQQWTPEDEYFDPALETAIQAFQQHRGIDADGTITDGTLRALREASYTLGARVLSLQPPDAYFVGDDVAELQSHLLDLGFFTSRVDGHFGEDTHSAVRLYQLNYGLTVDGICGPSTLRSLRYLGRRITGGSPQAIREKERIRAAGPQLTGKRIVLDPGLGDGEHGQIVKGPYGSITEEEILWDLATRTEGRMIAAGIETIISRPRTGNPSHLDRASIANAFGADLMISLRADSYPNERAHGAASFYFGSEIGRSSVSGEKLSNYILREVSARTSLTNLHSHRRTWDILRMTQMPAVQFVAGYLSNPDDVAVLTDPDARDTIAEALVVAVKRLYLLDADTAPTGTYRFADLLAAESGS
ncbi:N-acetylmuramoyl-L-alanine amidase [Candidatus Corynebacterium faecigallinarum]|uniref:N-acetylmuramoyl-L-alanine amidase n=1 Tax=Candidatus Corynebacterium faecigallinarum TaxID=2838528 RepID=UPI003FD1771E